MIKELTTEEQLKIDTEQQKIVDMFQSLKGGLTKPCRQAGCGIKWMQNKGIFEGSCRMSDSTACQYAALSRKYQMLKLPACQRMFLAKWEKQEKEANLAEFLAGGVE